MPLIPGYPRYSGPQKAGPLGWILVGCAVLAVLGGIAAVIGGFLFARRFRGLEKGNAEQIASVVKTIPGVELLSHDLASGKVTVRIKRDGKVMMVDAEDLKSGKFAMETAVTRVLPEWVPRYPGGTSPRAPVVSGITGTYEFATRDPVAVVTQFYENALKSAGFSTASSGVGVVRASTPGDRRTVVVKLHESGGETRGLVVFEEKP